MLIVLFLFWLIINICDLTIKGLECWSQNIFFPFGFVGLDKLVNLSVFCAKGHSPLITLGRRLQHLLIIRVVNGAVGSLEWNIAVQFFDRNQGFVRLLLIYQIFLEHLLQCQEIGCPLLDWDRLYQIAESLIFLACLFFSLLYFLHRQDYVHQSKVWHFYCGKYNIF